MSNAKTIQQDNTLFELRQKCIKEYRRQLIDQNVLNYCDTFISNLFNGKGIRDLKKWLSTNEKLKAIRQ